MTAWLYRVLPMVFGCHCREDRSFHWKGKRFPLCARCTGELAGILAAALSYGLLHPGPVAAALLLVPMVVDGGMRRVVTGTLFGYGIVCLFLMSTAAVFRLGMSLGSRFI